MPKKDYDAWCKGKEGVEHTVLPGIRRLGSLATCGMRGKHWVCVHVRMCAVCSRVLTYEWQMTPDDCPAYKEEVE